MDGGAVWLGRRLRGACYVVADGRAVPSCIMTVEEAAGKSLVTREGLAINGSLHLLQRAFLGEDAMPCGFCTSGMLMAVYEACGARVRRLPLTPVNLDTAR